MKRIVSSVLVLALGSVASAGTAWLEVDAADAKDSYGYSDVITINLVADTDVGYRISIGAVISDNGGLALEPLALHSNIVVFPKPGTIVNGGENPYVLVEYISGSTALFWPPVWAGEAIWSFDFHVPDVPYSTIIKIDDYTGDNPRGGEPYATRVEYLDFSAITTDLPVLEIHVTPEPMTTTLLGMGAVLLLRRRSKLLSVCSKGGVS